MRWPLGRIFELPTLPDSVIVDHAVHTKNFIVFKYFFFNLIDLIEKIIYIFNSF
jgi:hypothetical protein